MSASAAPRFILILAGIYLIACSAVAECPKGTTKVVTKEAMPKHNMAEEFKCVPDSPAGETPTQETPNPDALKVEALTAEVERVRDPEERKKKFLERLEREQNELVAANPKGAEDIQRVFTQLRRQAEGDVSTGVRPEMGEVFRDMVRYRDFVSRMKPIYDPPGGTPLTPREKNDIINQLSPYMNDKTSGFTDPMHEIVHNVYIENNRNPLIKDIATRSMMKERYDEIVSGGGGSPVGRRMRARDRLRRGDLEGALEDATEAAANGGGAAAHTIKAAAEFKLGDYQAAYNDARAALQLDPTDKEAFGIAKLARGQGATDMALPPPQPSGSAGGGGDAGWSARSAASAAGLNKGLGVSASSDYTRQAQAALANRDLRGAVARATRAIELNPQNASALYLRSIAYHNGRSYDLALKDAVAGLKLAPNNIPLLNAKARALNKMKDYRGALESADAALALNPNDAYARANRAYALGGLGDRDGMIADLKRAAALDSAFNSSLESALQAPADSDVVFLFPGEGPDFAARAAQAAPAPARKKSLGFVGAAALVGGGLLAFGLLPLILPALTKKVRAYVTERRSPAVSAFTPVTDSSGRPLLLRGQYELKREIGSGGMGVVYEGKDRSLDRSVAVKRMRPELAKDPRECQRFLSEARLVAGLHHPNIVDIYSIVEQDSDIFLIFEYVPGKTLFDLIAARGRMPWAEARRIVGGMAAALEFAHGRGVIHRDLKPSNVMIEEEGRVRVMDFGIARLAKDAGAKTAMTNTVVGTPPYMAPEQEQGVVSRHADLYALGVCLYEMLSGQLPFAGTGAGMLMNKMNMVYAPISEKASGLPAGIDEFFSRALAVEPARRFNSPKEFLAALDSLAQSAKTA